MNLESESLLQQQYPLPLYDKIRTHVTPDMYLSRSELIHETDAFMRRMQAVEAEFPLDTMFFLDKSGRPLAYLYRKLYPHYFSEQKPPRIKFLNVGGGASPDNGEVPFYQDPTIIRNVYGPHINTQGNLFVVDEFSSTGFTMNVAFELLKHAFPEARVGYAVAYTKMAKWQDSPFYLGVEEYDRDYFDEAALLLLNEETGASYGFDDLDVKLEWPIEDREVYASLRREIVSSIPYTRRGEHHSTVKVKRGLKEKIKTLDPRSHRDVSLNLFRQTRKDLDLMVEEIVRTP